MSKFHDTNYLQNDQYRDAGNLNARIRLHRAFSTNDYGWFRWVFDQYDLLANARVLELGCGPGDLWRENRYRIPNDWRVTLSDFSSGMVLKAQENLQQLSHPLAFLMAEAQNIPLPDHYCEILIANHCIYHVPDREKALAEISRVLKPGGWFYATTIGDSHLVEMSELAKAFEPAAEDVFANQQNPFTLESGGAQLRGWFSDVECSRYPDALHVTQAEPLVDFIFSTIWTGLGEEQREEFSEFIQDKIHSKGGVLRITKDSGMFIARKA